MHVIVDSEDDSIPQQSVIISSNSEENVEQTVIFSVMRYDKTYYLRSLKSVTSKTSYKMKLLVMLVSPVLLIILLSYPVQFACKAVQCTFPQAALAV